MKKLLLFVSVFALFASISAFAAADTVSYLCEHQGDGYTDAVVLTVMSEKEVVLHIPVWGVSPTYRLLGQDGGFNAFGDGYAKPLFELAKEFPARPLLRLDVDVYYGLGTGVAKWQEYSCKKSD